MDAAAWKNLSDYLDQVLEIEEPLRAAWLQALHQADPAGAVQIEALLEEHRRVVASRYLEAVPVRPPAHRPTAGEVLGAYRLISPIGQGGMGTVWLAERSDGRFERRVAIKFLQVAMAGRGEERFRREGRLLARLTHPHIAPLIDAGVTSEGEPYLVLEYVEGEPIDRYCARRGLELRARVAIMHDVLSAVGHAHANLIVHRDLKPSNILVTASGVVKLLDFGIAKLLDDTEGAAPLLTGDGGALTPAYAAPEQLTGGTISTATDVYAAGVVLYELVTGRHPAGDRLISPAALMEAILLHQPAALPGGDLGTILGKALKKRADERYASIAAFADDLQRALKREPIAARPDTIRYRMLRFTQRHPWPLAATAIVVLGLLIGLYTVNRERAVAERRFLQVRQLATRLLDMDAQILGLPGAAQTRQLLVDTALEYLRAATAEIDVSRDPELGLELGTAYMRVGRVQGVPISANLGQPDRAEENLQIAERLVNSVLDAEPGNRLALLRGAQIAHDRMVLAQARRPDTAALPLARTSEQLWRRYLDTGPIAPSEAQAVVITGMNIANWYGVKELTGENLRLLDRVVAIAKTTNQPGQAGASEIVRARTLRGAGDLEGALAAARRGTALLQVDVASAPVSRRLIYSLAVATEAEILGEHETVSLGRHTEAADLFEQAMVIPRQLLAQDSSNAQPRFYIADNSLRLAGVLLDSDTARALALSEEALARYSELPNNPRARRGEVRAHVAAARALIRLARADDAAPRLSAAFSRLAELKIYPAEQVLPGSEAFHALRGRAELLAATGDVAAAIRTLTSLAAAVAASGAKPATSLLDAFDVSLVDRDLTGLHRRAGEPDLAEATLARDRALWTAWRDRLPNNPFVERQLTTRP